jgi:hypothetical protein
MLRCDPVLLYGVNLPPGYGNDINIYMIFPTSSGMKGPEVITKDILDKGVIIRPQEVRKSVNHLPGFQLTDVVVELDPCEKTVDVPAVIELKYLLSTNYMESVSNDVKHVDGENRK